MGAAARHRSSDAGRHSPVASLSHIHDGVARHVGHEAMESATTGAPGLAVRTSMSEATVTRVARDRRQWQGAPRYRSRSASWAQLYRRAGRSSVVGTALAAWACSAHLPEQIYRVRAASRGEPRSLASVCSI